MTRPTPKPTLTIRLLDGAAEWDYAGVETSPGDRTSLTVATGEHEKIEIATAAGTLIPAPGQQVLLPDRKQHVTVTITAQDGAVWTRGLELFPKKQAVLTTTYTPSRGQVLVTKVGDAAPIMRCSTPRCVVTVEPGTQVQLSALVNEGATFAGFKQYPMRTPTALVKYLGDPLADCKPDLEGKKSIRECGVKVALDTDVGVEFGKEPDRVEVAFADPSQLDKLIKPLTPPPPPPPIDAEKLEEKPPQVAIEKPKPPPQIKPLQPPPPPPPEQKKPPPPQTLPPAMTMVEVKDDKDLKKEAPDDAKFLSDKNRDVAEETRAQKTNLDKESEGHSEASKESDDKTSAEIGGPDDKIRQLEETQSSTDKHLKETDHSGEKEVAKGVIKGNEGENGENGEGDKTPGILSMRGIGGRGALTEQGDGKKKGKQGLPGINTDLAFNDYERIMGHEKVDEERQVAARKMSSKKGRWERKLDAIKSSLENFVPDVRPGNQTALKTRAHPFALYVARMHRRIHELWGFGFLEDLDNKPADYPLNDPNLWVNLEISVNPDGSVHKVTIAKTSGKTEFDVAAVDTVISAAPFEPTPEQIRSVDGRIYLRWGFYRNWRQCGTFNVEPYILTEVPDDGGQGVLDDGAMVANTAHVPGKKKHGPVPTGDKPVTPDDGLAKQKVNPDSDVTDKQALFAANLWVSAFATAQVDKLVKYSTVPFYAGGQVAASTQGDLKEMYSGLVVESGPMKDWKLLTSGEYAQASNGGSLPPGNVVLQVRTAKETFAVVLTKTNSGEYRATQLAR
ncbi:MAG: TonB family protein [Deltaproteobacteria bacterium]|nr:TonB family protein [Deltaproteobacteria bacterium]